MSRRGARRSAGFGQSLETITCELPVSSPPPNLAPMDAYSNVDMFSRTFVPMKAAAAEQSSISGWVGRGQQATLGHISNCVQTLGSDRRRCFRAIPWGISNQKMMIGRGSDSRDEILFPNTFSSGIFSMYSQQARK